MFWKYAANLHENTHVEVWFQQNCKAHIYWNHPSAWMFSCKFAVYFQNTFSLEHFWKAAYVRSCFSANANVVLGIIIKGRCTLEISNKYDPCISIFSKFFLENWIHQYIKGLYFSYTVNIEFKTGSRDF